MVREAISLQIGGFANYTGAHFWNIQDEAFGLAQTDQGKDYHDCLDAQVIYHQGSEQQQAVPRLVLLDLCGSLGGVSANAGSPANQEATGQTSAVTTWSGDTEVHHTERVRCSDFVQQLKWEEEEGQSEGPHADQSSEPSPIEVAAEALQHADAVQYWTDYSKVQLHPKSVWQAPGLWHGTASAEGFFGVAAALQGQESREEVGDRVRFFAEGCDALQGFNVLVDDVGGWGQPAVDLLTELQDDYPSSPVLLWAVRQPDNPSKEATSPASRQQRQLSKAISYARLAPLASTYCCVVPPVASLAPHLLPQRIQTAFGASGAIAAVLDCATLPWRLPRHDSPATSHLGSAAGAMDMGYLTQLLQGSSGSSLAALRVALPAPSPPRDPHSMAASTDARQHQPHQQARGQQRRQPSYRSDSQTDDRGSAAPPVFTRDAASWTPDIRGASHETQAEAVVLRGARVPGTAATSDYAAAALDASLAAEGVRCVRQRCVAPFPVPVPLPFPHLFGPTIGRFGDVYPAKSTPSTVVSMPMMTRLASTREFQQVLSTQRRHLHSAAKSVLGHALLAAWGLDRNDIGESTEQLHSLISEYGSEHEDDD